MPERDFYKPEEISECPSCGSTARDSTHTRCWHCADCGFAICAHYKYEVDEIRARRAIPESKIRFMRLKYIGKLILGYALYIPLLAIVMTLLIAFGGVFIKEIVSTKLVDWLLILLVMGTVIGIPALCCFLGNILLKSANKDRKLAMEEKRK